MEPCVHDLGGLLDATPGWFLYLCNRSECHRIQGDNGVLALKTHQHVLRYLLRQDATLDLQLVIDDLVQFLHLGPCGVKRWEHSAHLLYRFPRAEWTKAEGHQRSLSLDQKLPNLLRLDRPGRLELL
jgi:hypothetical protein